MTTSELHFYQLLRDFLTTHLVTCRQASPQTIRSYRQSLRQYVTFLRDEKHIRFDRVDFTCFTTTLVYEFLTWLRDDRACSAATLNLRLSAIKSFLTYCADEDLDLMPAYLHVATIRGFRPEQAHRVDYLTQPHLKQLFTTPDVTTKLGRRDRFFLILAYETGARIQEMLDLTCGSITRDGEYVRIRIHGKGSKTRHVPLMAPVVAHLDAYLDEFHPTPHPGDHLFYTIHNGGHTQMTPGTVDHFMKKYGRQAHMLDPGFPERLHAHMLRHSIAMAMHTNGIPISYIKDFLGHVSIDTTMVYAHADDTTIADALTAIDHPEHDPAMTPKKWKDKEHYLLDYCGLA